MTSNTPELYGLILMGGESSRMGSDKSLLEFQGEPQYHFLYKLLSTICDNVFLSCNSIQVTYIPDNFKKLVDNKLYKGPMTGIRSAFNHKETNWLIVPIDMPYINEEVLNLMKKNLSGNEDVICTKSREGHINPLLAIYKKSCAQFLIDFKGDSPRKFIENLSTQKLIIDDIQNININTAEDLEAFKNTHG